MTPTPHDPEFEIWSSVFGAAFVRLCTDHAERTGSAIVKDERIDAFVAEASDLADAALAAYQRLHHHEQEPT